MAERITTVDSTESIVPEEETTIDENIIAAATIEQANELVALDRDPSTNKWTLSLGPNYENQWKNATRNAAFIVSLLGNTTAGKSFLTKHLLANAENGPQTVNESEIASSTTGNINCYLSKLNNDLPETILILDYEGEKGSSFPLMLSARRFFAEHVGFNRDYAVERRKSVTEYFPKLAYVLSNIVILIGKEELISADYLNRCYEFTRSANTNIADIPYLPVLIIIENKCSLAKNFGIDEVTDEFFRIHQTEIGDLQNYFSKIYCIRLPHTDQLQKVKGSVLDGEVIFEQQLSVLKKIIQEVIVKDRERLITHSQWLFLLKRVLDSVSNGKPVSIHSLLSEITRPIDGDDDQFLTKRLFNKIYNDKTIRTPKHFRHCRELAMKMFSRYAAIQLLRREQILSDRLIRDVCKTQMPIMWNLLNEFKPCEALYTGVGEGVSGNPVFCYQSKGAHPNHRTSEGIKNASWISSLFGWSFTQVWDGKFVSNDAEELSERELENLTSLTIQLVNAFRQNSEEKIKTFKIILQAAHMNRTVIVRQTIRCSCCLNGRQLNETSDPNLPLNRFFKSLFNHNPDVLTVCQECQQILNEAPHHDSSDVSRNLLATVISPSSTAQDEENCIICMAYKKDHVLVPCGHGGFCVACATRVQEVYKFCPICRVSVQSILKVHDV